MDKENEQFALSIEKPERVMIPYLYQEFLLMDILHLSKEEIGEMDYMEYFRAVNYAWTAYCLRRVDMPFRKHTKEEKEITSFNFRENMKQVHIPRRQK